MAEGNGRVWSADIKDLGDRIVTLTVGKAVELGDYMEQVHGIKPAASAVVAAGPAAAGPAVAEKPAEKTEFTVSLDSFGADKIKVIKEVRAITGLGLKEAKEVVEGAPRAIKENISKEEAEKYKKMLEDVGAKVSLK